MGDYEVLDELGRGAIGVVYRARHPEHGEVALKVLHEEVAGDAEVEHRFERETRIALALSHPNLVRAIEAGSAGGKLFLACELVPGGSLAELGVVPADRLRRIAHDVLQGLGAVHAAGIIHRDIKPSNVLLAADGTAKLSDLGLARSTSMERTQFTQQGMVVGTPAYLSPEQVKGTLDLDIRSDLYAFGILLYECLAGKPPFEGENLIQTMWMHVDAPVPELPDAPPDLAELIGRLLAKEPDDRPADPAAVLALLQPEAELFPATIVGGEFPATLAGGEFPSTLAGTAFPQTMDAPPVAGPPVELTSEGEPMDRGALELSGRTLFVYGGTRLQAGRNNLSHSEQDVCLRVPGDRDKSRRISGRHLAVRFERDRFEVVDLESTGGTRLDGRALPPGAPQPLPAMATIAVADVVKLQATTIPAPASRPPALGADVADGPALLLDERFALIPGRLALRALLPGAPADAELFFCKGGLWLRGASETPDRCVALADGLQTPWGLRVRRISEEDQK